MLASAGLPTEFYHHEIYQNWIDPKGGETIVSKSYQRSFNYHNWDYASPWGIGTHNAHCSGYYMMGDVYDNTGNFYFPKFGISRTIRRNGLNTKDRKAMSKLTGWPDGVRDKIAWGFTLTGRDDLEPGASLNTERIRTMRYLHDAGFLR